MAIHQFTASVSGLSRYAANLESVTLVADRELWRDVQRLFSARSYRPPGLASVTVTVDWAQVVDVVFRDTQFTTREWMAKVDNNIDLVEDVRVEVPVQVIDENDAVKAFDARQLVELFFHEAFIVSNLAVPGSFGQTQIVIKHLEYGSVTLLLDSSLFEDAWITATRHAWPHVEVLPIFSVIEWYDSLNLGTQQVATSRVAKALFSLLHVAAMDRTEPTAVVWLAQALEALFDVPSALSHKFLSARVLALLGSPRTTKWFKSQIRQFYEARNAFAHGGAPVIHPMYDDGLDPRVDEECAKWMDPSDFAASIVVSALQAHVKNRSAEIAWEERPIFRGRGA